MELSGGLRPPYTTLLSSLSRRAFGTSSFAYSLRGRENVHFP